MEVPGESVGTGPKPSDPHYRAYVGPPEDYDLIAAMTFNLLTTLGLRQHHSVLDVGCGSLQIGRLLFPYLNRGKYFGVEPNEWLVKEGSKRELGEALVQIKRPTFFFSDSPETAVQAKVSSDFALTQSIFSDCGLDLIRDWLSGISRLLAQNGALIATLLPGDEDSPRAGWVYPECVSYRPATLEVSAGKAGLRFEILDWNMLGRHGRFLPRQTLTRDGSRIRLSLGTLDWKTRLAKRKVAISVRFSRMFRAAKIGAESTGCGNG